MSKSREQVQDFLREIDITGKTVLDVGAGPESKWARNWTKGEPKEYKTADINPEWGCDYTFDLNLWNIPLAIFQDNDGPQFF